MWADNSKALKHRMAFKRYTGALTAITLATRFKICKLLRSHESLEVALEELRVEVHSSDYTLKALRLDNEFWSAPVRTWAALCDPPIGDIGRFNQTLENTAFKKMYAKRHLTEQYWGMAYEDYIVKAYFMNSVHGRKEHT